MLQQGGSEFTSILSPIDCSPPFRLLFLPLVTECQPRCGTELKRVHFQAFTRNQMGSVPKKLTFLAELKIVRLGEPL